jgi:hypothetical protein
LLNVLARYLAIYLSFCISPLNDNAFPFHLSKLAQALPECLVAGQAGGRSRSLQVSDPGDFLRLLRLAGNASSQKDSKQ